MFFEKSISMTIRYSVAATLMEKKNFSRVSVTWQLAVA